MRADAAGGQDMGDVKVGRESTAQDKRRRRRRRRGTGAIVLGCALLACALCILAWVGVMRDQATAPDPGGSSHATSTRAGEGGKSPKFPKVNWDRWSALCPDLVGWVSVPGTTVSYPVVKERNGEPGFYLHHGSNRAWNVYGAVYLDSESDAGLLTSDNAVVYGHHMNDGTMFAPLASYSSADWARSHRTVLVQTRKHKCAYHVVSTDILNAWSEEKLVRFGSHQSFSKWRDGKVSGSRTRLSKARSDRVMTLVTCSYHYSGNERTVAYCEPWMVDGKRVSGRKCADALGRTPSERTDARRAERMAVEQVERDAAALDKGARGEAGDSSSEAG